MGYKDGMHVIHFAVPEKQWKLLSQIAEEQGRPVANLINFIINQYTKKYEVTTKEEE